MRSYATTPVPAKFAQSRSRTSVLESMSGLRLWRRRQAAASPMLPSSASAAVEPAVAPHWLQGSGLSRAVDRGATKSPPRSKRPPLRCSRRTRPARSWQRIQQALTLRSSLDHAAGVSAASTLGLQAVATTPAPAKFVQSLSSVVRSRIDERTAIVGVGDQLQRLQLLYSCRFSRLVAAHLTLNVRSVSGTVLRLLRRVAASAIQARAHLQSSHTHRKCGQFDTLRGQPAVYRSCNAGLSFVGLCFCHSDTVGHSKLAAPVGLRQVDVLINLALCRRLPSTVRRCAACHWSIGCGQLFGPGCTRRSVSTGCALAMGPSWTPNRSSAPLCRRLSGRSCEVISSHIAGGPH